MLWLEDLAQKMPNVGHAYRCENINKFRRTEVAPWRLGSVLVGLHKHFLTHVIHCFVSFAYVLFVDL